MSGICRIFGYSTGLICSKMKQFIELNVIHHPAILVNWLNTVLFVGLALLLTNTKILLTF